MTQTKRKRTGRGLTVANVVFDEFAFMKYNSLTFLACVPAWKKASENALITRFQTALICHSVYRQHIIVSQLPIPVKNPGPIPGACQCKCFQIGFPDPQFPQTCGHPDLPIILLLHADCFQNSLFFLFRTNRNVPDPARILDPSGQIRGINISRPAAP